jgi:hypothetical protein
MEIIRNERQIRILSNVGQYAVLGGLVALLAGLAISFIKPEWTGAMLISVTVGFFLSLIGGFFSNRYASPQAHHEVLAEMLKGLDYRHTLFQYVLPTSHVLLEPGGCTVFVVKPQGGRVIYEDGQWKHKQRGKFFRRMVGEEALGNPEKEAQRAVGKLKDYLAEQMLEDADKIPVRAAIVFINPDVQVEADDAPTPAFYRKKVKNWLRGPGDLDPLPDELQQKLATALGAEQENGE